MHLPIPEVEAINQAKAQRKEAEAGASAIARKRAGAEVEPVRNAATAAVAAVGRNDQEQVEMTLVIIHGNDGDDLNRRNLIILLFPLQVQTRRPPRRLRLLMSQP